ncbi:MAG: HU family DNA-binding protein, partial [Alphaproteobacteria bacterium]
MNKSELIAAVAEATGISKSDASSAVDATFDVISDALTNGDDVRLTGFGSFTIVECAAREGRNPRTGNP